MRALNLWEPWASCIAAGLKQVETRSWRLPRGALGEPVAFGAAKAWHRDEAEEALLCLGNVPGALDRLGAHLGGDPWKSASYPLGCVVATATFTACVPTQNVRVRTADDGDRRLYRDVDWGPQLLSIPMVERELGGYDFGRFAFVLGDVVKVDQPVPARGKQGWWEWTP